MRCREHFVFFPKARYSEGSLFRIYHKARLFRKPKLELGFRVRIKVRVRLGLVLGIGIGLGLGLGLELG